MRTMDIWTVILWCLLALWAVGAVCTLRQELRRWKGE